MYQRRRLLQFLAMGGCLSTLPAGPSRSQGVGTDYDVIVIGAGLAGLVAAHRLATLEAELKVLVLEARDRIGGRVHSLERPELRRRAEQGALFLPDDPDWAPLDEYDLTVTPMGPGRRVLEPAMGALVDALAAGSVGRVQLSSEVTRVFWSEGLVGVNYLNRGLESAVSARSLVVTVPPTVLQRGDISFSPELPAAKRAAFAAVTGSPALVLAGIFAPEDAALPAGQDRWIKEDESRCLRAFVAGARGEVLLEAEYRGSRAALLATQPRELVETLFLRDFADALVRQPDRGQALWLGRTDWGAEPFSAGAWLSAPNAATQLALGESLANTLHFGGDTTQVGAARADLASAYASGERVARAVALSLDVIFDPDESEAPVLDPY
jgi:hypothetical protein